MITIYFPDGSYRKVTAVEGQQLVQAGKAFYTPFDTLNINTSSEPETQEEEQQVTESYEKTINPVWEKETETPKHYNFDD